MSCWNTMTLVAVQDCLDNAVGTGQANTIFRLLVEMSHS